MRVHMPEEYLPQVVELRKLFTSVYDQGQLGSCTANSICGLVRFRLRNFNPSRLFLYYNERNIEGTETTDSGAYLSDGVKSLREQGICSELVWPYDIQRFAEYPPSPCYKLAVDHRFYKSHNIDNTDIQQIKLSLYNNDPFVFGFAVYDSFESPEVARTGIMSLPGEDEKMLGGHAVLAVGYNDHTQTVTCINSWGSNWGDAGFFHMPYAYITNPDLTSDAWTFNV